MENELKGNSPECPDGVECGFGLLAEKLACTPNGNGCQLFNLAEADESEFHDKQLAEATQTIKGILDGIKPDAAGRKISLIKTNAGLLLAWVDHSGTVLKNGLTQDSDPTQLAAALKLKS